MKDIEKLRMPQISQYRHFIHDARSDVQFSGLDESGEPVFDTTRLLPVIPIVGTVKVHGTNGGITLDDKGVVRYYSKRKMLSLTDDNFGFCRAMSEVPIAKIIKNLGVGIIPPGSFLELRGEWCGGSIQSGVGINGLHKMFIIFAIKLRMPDGRTGRLKVPAKAFPEYHVYTAPTFGVFTEEVDLNEPHKAQESLVKRTNGVEDDCPVARYFGTAGTGEGVVWETVGDFSESDDKYLRFKVKGAKHSVSKVRQLAKPDTEKLNSVTEFVAYSLTENRLKQAMSEFTEGDKTLKQTGAFIKWVKSDVFKEETDTLLNSGLTAGDVAGQLAKVASAWYRSNLV